MKVRLIVARGGDGFSQMPGDEIDVDPATGARMIESQQAEAVESVRKVEAETVAPAETAALRTRSPRGRKPKAGRSKA